MSDEWRKHCMATDRISVRINPELRRGLQKHASLNGKRKSDVVREALEAYFVDRGSSGTCFDLALKAGLIGAARNAPRNLSTERKHFRGFGRSKRGDAR
jgi:predicted transcriptional regulator